GLERVDVSLREPHAMRATHVRSEEAPLRQPLDAASTVGLQRICLLVLCLEQVKLDLGASRRRHCAQPAEHALRAGIEVDGPELERLASERRGGTIVEQNEVIDVHDLRRPAFRYLSNARRQSSHKRDVIYERHAI